VQAFVIKIQFTMFFFVPLPILLGSLSILQIDGYLNLAGV